MNDNRPEPLPIGYSSPVAARVAGITFRQLDYWTRVDAVQPAIAASGSGSRRRWSTSDVRRLAVLSLLVNAVPGQIDVVVIGAVWNYLGAEFKFDPYWVYLVVEAGGRLEVTLLACDAEPQRGLCVALADCAFVDELLELEARG